MPWSASALITIANLVDSEEVLGDMPYLLDMSMRQVMLTLLRY